MKKSFSYLLTAFVGALIIVGTIIFVVLSSNNKTTADTLSFEPVDACKALTLDEAKAVLGISTSQNTSPPTATRDDIQTSICSYSNKTQTAMVTVRSPLHRAGLTSIDTSFHGRMYNYTLIKGYGHHAYYDDSVGQLNVHDDGSWYIISLGGDQPGSFSLANAELVADQVFN